MVSVNDYAALSAAVYDNAGVGLTSDSGWIRLQNYSDAESGFYAALFENGAGERVLAFRGTEPFTPQDVSTDRAVLKAQTPEQLPQQFVEAQRIFGEVSSQYGADGLSVTGHSLGGGTCFLNCGE